MACSPAPGSHGPNRAPGACSGNPHSHAIPDTCSIVIANPVRSRHGPERPKAGIRTMIAAGLIARTSSHDSPNESITRGL